MEIKEAFGLALKQIRLAKGLTQEDFSNVSSRTYISTLERYKYSPTLEKTDEIARHMGIHPLTLISIAYLKIENEESIESLQRILEKEIRILFESANEFSLELEK